MQTLDMTDYKTPEDLKGNDYPGDGQFHVVVNRVDDSHEKIDGLKVEFYVLAGTVEHCTGKRWEEAFFWPNQDAKDGGKFARKRLAALAFATGLVTPADLGKQVEINWPDMLYRQLKLAVRSYSRTKDGKTYRGAEIDGMGIWGPLDEEAAHIPIDPNALQMAKDAGQANCQAASPTPAARPNPVAKPSATKPAATPSKPAPAAAPASPAPSNKAPAADPYGDL